MRIIIVNPTYVLSRIVEFYTNAKNEKYDNSYGWDEVFNDIDLAQSDTNFTPYNSSRQDWINAGYKVVINQRGWVFAYLMKGNDMCIYDAENYRNLDTHIEDIRDLNLYKQLSTAKTKQVKPYSSLGYGWWAIRHDDGYIYIHHKNGNIMPNVRFNEIVRQFRQRKDDPYIYAVGQYGGKNFKLYLNGQHVMLENRRLRNNVIRLTESQFHKMLVECISKIISEIA